MTTKTPRRGPDEWERNDPNNQPYRQRLAITIDRSFHDDRAFLVAHGRITSRPDDETTIENSPAWNISPTRALYVLGFHLRAQTDDARAPRFYGVEVSFQSWQGVRTAAEAQHIARTLSAWTRYTDRLRSHAWQDDSIGSIVLALCQFLHIETVSLPANTIDPSAPTHADPTIVTPRHAAAVLDDRATQHRNPKL